MPWDKDSPLSDSVLTETPEERVENLARQNIFVNDPEFQAPMHPGPTSGQLQVMPPFFAGKAVCIDTTGGVEVGKFVFVDDFAVIYSHVHDPNNPRFWEPVASPLVIEDFVHIKPRVTITGECNKIGEGAVICEGVIVTEDIPPFAIITKDGQSGWRGNEFKEDQLALFGMEEEPGALEGLAEAYGYSDERNDE
jgi:hypothetical protein